MLVLFQVVEQMYDLKSPPELVQAMFACFEAICPCLLEAQLGGKGRAIYENNAAGMQNKQTLPSACHQP
jgi:hypothetical protein